jgi:hypothetical protein
MGRRLLAHLRLNFLLDQQNAYENFVCEIQLRRLRRPDPAWRRRSDRADRRLGHALRQDRQGREPEGRSRGAAWHVHDPEGQGQRRAAFIKGQARRLLPLSRALPDAVHPVEKDEDDNDRKDDEGGVMGAEAPATDRMMMLLVHMFPRCLQLSRLDLRLP